jgi:hypothetical protein
LMIINYFSFVTQFVFVFLPGRQPLNYYVCSNKLKVSLIDEPDFKLNWQLTFLQLFSLFLHVFANVRIKLYKVKQERSVFVISNLDHNKNGDISSIDNRAISDFVTNVLAVLATSSFGITTSLVNWTSPKMFNVYPYYLIVYFMHFVVPFLITGTIALLYYIRHPPLRKTIYREIKLRFKNYV